MLPLKRAIASLPSLLVAGACASDAPPPGDGLSGGKADDPLTIADLADPSTELGVWIDRVNILKREGDNWDFGDENTIAELPELYVELTLGDQSGVTAEPDEYCRYFGAEVPCYDNTYNGFTARYQGPKDVDPQVTGTRDELLSLDWNVEIFDHDTLSFDDHVVSCTLHLTEEKFNRLEDPETGRYLGGNFDLEGCDEPEAADLFDKIGVVVYPTVLFEGSRRD